MKIENKEMLIKYELALNTAIDILGNNEICDVLEDLVTKIGECINEY
ncbi:hypothetical protein ACOJB1_14450 [Enterococcus innesii]